MNIWNQSHTNKEWADAFTLFNSIEINSYDEYISKFDWDNPETRENAEARRTLTFFFEGLGVFVKEGYIGIRPIALLMTRLTRVWWEKSEPYVKIHRERGNYPRYLSEAEYLYDELMKYLEEHPEFQT